MQHFTSEIKKEKRASDHMLKPQNRPLLAVTKRRNLGVAPLGGWAGSHPSYSAPLVAESTSVFAGWLPWQPNKAGLEARGKSFPNLYYWAWVKRIVISSQQ